MQQYHQINKQYDQQRMDIMYQFPAKVYQAKIHQKANAYGYNNMNYNGGQVPQCACCELPMNTMRINMKYGTTPSSNKIKQGTHVFLLNSSSSMFFTFIKMLIVYLLMRFLITDAFNIYSSMTGQFCTNQNIECSFMAKTSAYNKNHIDSTINVVDYLNLVATIFSIVFFLVYGRMQYKIYALVDSENHTQDDYTILVEDIPIFLLNPENENQFNYQAIIKKAFEDKINNWIDQVNTLNYEDLNQLQKNFRDNIIKGNTQFKNQTLKVRSISLCFDLSQLQKINSLRQKLMAEYNQLRDSGKQELQTVFSKYYIPNQINYLNNQFIELSKKFADDNSASFNLGHFVGKAFVSFEYQHYRQYFLREHKHSNNITIRQKPLNISQAAEPSDVYWYNMKIQNSQRTKSVLFSYMILLLSLAASFTLLLLLIIYQEDVSPTLQNNPDQSVQNMLLSYVFTALMTVLVMVINMILAAVIKMLTVSEKHQTMTNYTFSLLIKNIIAQFLNTAIIFYIISLIRTDQGGLSKVKNALSENGLVVRITSLIAISGFISVFTNAAQFGSLFTAIWNKCKYGDLDGQVNIFQIQLNKKLQDPQFAFADRYTYYIMNIYVVSFYSYIAPSISFFLAIIFFAQYWVDKYNLFVRFSSPTDFNYSLSRSTFKTFQLSILFFTLGNLLFSQQIHSPDEKGYKIVNWISFVIALIFSLLVVFIPKKWQERIFSTQSFEQKSYSDCINGFERVYWLSNYGTNFAKQKDLNGRHNQSVQYSQNNKIADKTDFEQFQNIQKNGKVQIARYNQSYVDKLNKQFLGTAIVQNISQQLNIAGFAKPGLQW